MAILSVNRNNIKLDDANFLENDLKNITHIRRLAWYIKFKQREAFKKEISKELIHVPRPTKWWDWCMSEDEKKEIEPFLIEEK